MGRTGGRWKGEIEKGDRGDEEREREKKGGMRERREDMMMVQCGPCECERVCIGK